MQLKIYENRMSYYLQSKIHGIGNLRKENFFGLNGKLMYLEKFFIIIIIIVIIIIIIKYLAYYQVYGLMEDMYFFLMFD